MRLLDAQQRAPEPGDWLASAADRRWWGDVPAADGLREDSRRTEILEQTRLAVNLRQSIRRRDPPAEATPDSPALVLAVLADRPIHGYEIASTIPRRSAGALVLGRGTLYPTLHRLEREGLIAGRWEVSSGGPERRVCRLTPQGHAALVERQAEWAAFVDVVGRFLGPSRGRIGEAPT